MPFEFYLPDINNWPLYFEAFVKACAAGLLSVVLILIVDYLQYPKWLAIKKGEQNRCGK